MLILVVWMRDDDVGVAILEGHVNVVLMERFSMEVAARRIMFT
jgi:hypothetical protein